ncbi:unnamed protein product, partial [Urochloa humidicola]
GSPPLLLRAAPPPGLGPFAFSRERRRLPASVPSPILSFPEHCRGWPSSPAIGPHGFDPEHCHRPGPAFEHRHSRSLLPHLP